MGSKSATEDEDQCTPADTTLPMAGLLGCRRWDHITATRAMAARGSRRDSCEYVPPWKLGAVSPSWALAARGMASQPHRAVSLAQAQATRAQGATAATLHLLYGEDEDNPLGLSSFGPWQAQ